jgi:hypothetical protein
MYEFANGLELYRFVVGVKMAMHIYRAGQECWTGGWKE